MLPVANRLGEVPSRRWTAVVDGKTRWRATLDQPGEQEVRERCDQMGKGTLRASRAGEDDRPPRAWPATAACPNSVWTTMTLAPARIYCTGDPTHDSFG